MLQFGEFDRDEAIYNILQIVSPVTAEELAEYVHMEYGYDKLTAMWNYFKHLNQYYHNHELFDFLYLIFETKVYYHVSF